MRPTPEEVQTWLEWAGAKILALNVGPTRPADYRVAWPDYPDDPEMAYGSGYRDIEMKLPAPSSTDIPFIDEILALVVVIPNPVRRRIVSSRAIVRPVSGRPLFGWERLGKLLHADRKTVQREHARGIREICELTPCDKVRRIGGFMAHGA